jgi:hypothetical protein
MIPTPKKILKILSILAILVQTISCTHYLIETETRIRMKNETDVEISNLSLISKNGEIKVLVPETVEAGKRSKGYEHEWVGKFTFVVFVGDSPKDLGTHELKGGSVEAIIDRDFNMTLK